MPRRLDQRRHGRDAGAAADDVRFVGPLALTVGADEYVTGVEGMSRFVTGAEQHQVIVDGDDVASSTTS